jgi:3-oxoadipate enol-lactonase
MQKIDAGGTELSYARAGSGDPMLLIQGMSATHLAWGRPFLDELEGSFETIVFDNRGMGTSGRAQMPFTIADMAADTAALLDALEIERAHVVGVSMGGTIAQQLALSQPQRISSLTLGATWAGGPDARLMARQDLEMLGAAQASGDGDGVLRAMWEINASPSFRADDSRFAAFSEMGRTLPAPQPVILQQMRACAAHDTTATLGGLEPPTLVIHGTADRLIPVENGKAVASLIPGSRLELLEDVGHVFWWEQPQRSAELIREHALTQA